MVNYQWESKFPSSHEFLKKSKSNSLTEYHTNILTLTHSLIGTHSNTNSLTLILTFTHSLPDSHTYSLTDTHSFTLWQYHIHTGMVTFILISKYIFSKIGLLSGGGSIVGPLLLFCPHNNLKISTTGPSVKLG